MVYIKSFAVSSSLSSASLEGGLMSKPEDLSYQEKIDLMIADLITSDPCPDGWYPGIAIIPKDKSPKPETDVYCIAISVLPGTRRSEFKMTNIGFLLKHAEKPGFLEAMDNLDYELRRFIIVKQWIKSEILENLDFPDYPLDMQALHQRVKALMDNYQKEAVQNASNIP